MGRYFDTHAELAKITGENVVPFPGPPRSSNDMLIARIKGQKAMPGTPETDADPHNPATKAQ